MNSGEKATFRAGCFWKTEDAFRRLPGVLATSVGYMGGHFPNPSYLDVLSRITGHAEVAQIAYNPQEISYEALLAVFWSIHDPTQLNRQDRTRENNIDRLFSITPRNKKLIATASKRQLQLSGKFQQAYRYFDRTRRRLLSADQSHQQYLEKKQARLVGDFQKKI
ncbi:MAG UNVERIFIED_CONTAM: peptide-methionine (S)-S-oxide reductase MsrA [Microcystis novacekii LVE1205-3]|jgi:peptide-methionine (S)-S-oxide reductase